MTNLRKFRFLCICTLCCVTAFNPCLWAKETFNRDWVPQPVFEKEPGYVDLYWTAWEQAWDHVATEDGLPQSPYMDEAFARSHVWIWDTAFMVLFCKYSPERFPGVETLNNFYRAFHSERYKDGSFPLGIQHPDNPPLFAWAEYGNFLFTGDVAHTRTLLTESQYLQKHFNWFHNLSPGWQLQTQQGLSAEVTLNPKALGYQWSGCSSGMDNTPRHREALWIDAIAQQGLSALVIARMAERIGETSLAAEWNARYARIRETVNTYYWDEADGFYYDISEDGSEFHKVKTPASYWPLLAEMATPEQAARMVEHLRDPNSFGGLRPWVTVARNDPTYYGEDGAYWRGGIWLPTAYMGTKALEKYGYQAEADTAAENLLAHMYRTNREVEPNTIWECYSPSRDHPVVRLNGHIVRPDFCGWSALGPISMFIENVLGFHAVDALQKRVAWRLHQQSPHGLRNFKFGSITADLLYDGKGTVTVSSTAPFTLEVNGSSYAVQAGDNRFAIRALTPETVEITIENADGSGTYPSGRGIELSAPASKDGKQFYNWTSTGGILDRPESKETLFWVPLEAASVTAHYRKICTVRFALPETLKAVGGGALIQQVVEGRKAEAPNIRADYGWAFDGWDHSLDAVTQDLIITAIASPSSALLENGNFSKDIKMPAKWDEFTVQSSELDLWYIPLFGDRFKLATDEARAPYLVTGGMWQGTNCYQTLAAPDTGAYTFGFDYRSTEVAGTAPNHLSWVIWGYTKEAADDRLTYGGEVKTLAELPHTGTVLACGDFKPGNSPWESFQSQPFEITSGLSRIVLGIRVHGVNARDGDQMALDAVELNIFGE